MPFITKKGNAFNTENKRGDPVTSWSGRHRHAGSEPPNKRICPLCKGSKETNQKICIPCLRKKQVGTIFHPDYKPPFNEELHEQHSRGNY